MGESRLEQYLSKASFSSSQDKREAENCAAAIVRDRDALQDVLIRHGFVRCDIAACNCGSWHPRYGLAERYAEVRYALEDAGHPLTNENGNLVGSALKALVDERDNLQSRADLADRLATLVRQSKCPSCDGSGVHQDEHGGEWPCKFCRLRRGYAQQDTPPKFSEAISKMKPEDLVCP